MKNGDSYIISLMQGQWRKKRTPNKKPKRNPSPLAKKDGTITIHVHTKSRKVKTIKVNGKKVFLSRHVWEQAHGPIPPGLIITFRDNDPMNCDLSNLELTTHSERMKKYPACGVPYVITEINRLRKAINKKIKTLKSKE
jgi:hypothetical protein